LDDDVDDGVQGAQPTAAVDGADGVSEPTGMAMSEGDARKDATTNHERVVDEQLEAMVPQTDTAAWKIFNAVTLPLADVNGQKIASGLTAPPN
jgi:hypothetical protein